MITLVFAVVIYSCKKDPDPIINPPISDIPEIVLSSVAPTTVEQFTDDIIFSIHYLDGNGDLGFEEADSLSLFIIDNRVPLTNKFHIPPLSPIGSDITIEGDLNVVLENVIVLDTANATETTTFTIKLKDRAGNWSNEVISQSITITQ